ncbi:succinate dehydrogenase assembly factor 2 [Glaciecola sp. 1036]|uniref:FAD assembly factor SdhE n=1 Tax=Alteromonadaceae TaxID=72275 RepID=UPI003D0609DA
MFEAKRLARLKWACRRGMLELDVLLMPFVEQAFDDLSYQQKVVFEKLLTSDDPDLFAWFMGHQKCPQPDFAQMIETVKTSIKIE